MRFADLDPSKHPQLTPYLQALKQQLLTGNPLNLCSPPASICGQTKGIDRSNMPQFDDASGQQFIDSLKSQGIKVTNEEIAVGQLQPSQNEINANFIRQALKNIDCPIDEPAFVEGHPLYASGDNYVLDGHHRWGALLVYSLFTHGSKGQLAHTVKIWKPFDELVQIANGSALAGHAGFEENDNPFKQPSSLVHV